MKITYKTSKEHTEKLLLEFFKKTSIPRFVEQKRDEKKQDKAI